MYQPQDTPKLIIFPQKSIILSLLQCEMIYQSGDIINHVYDLAFFNYNLMTHGIIQRKREERL